MNIPITQTGKRIQNYVFNYTDFLGAGNFSKCYKGYNQLTNEVVAIKIVQLNSLKSKKLQELLFQEIQILKKLNHPSVLKCYQIFTSNRNCYIITELCNQGNLQNRLKLKKVFDQTEANPIIKDVYDGLLYLAENNIVHRDLKSANIFLHNGRAKIADFGFAKEIKHNFKDLNIGSPLYMAPQGILHNIYGPKTQVWALGILVYELFHGSSPYIYCKTQQQLKRSVTIPLNWKQLRKDISQDIKQFILICLQINEQKRSTIEQLGNLGYIRRLNQININYQANKFDFRSPSKSVHLNTNQQNQLHLEFQKQRINNNFRQLNNPLSREVSRSKNNQRQVIFRSVDMRGNNRNKQLDFQSPNKSPVMGPIKFNMNSPGTKRPQMISSIRPTSSMNTNYINNPQSLPNYQTQQFNVAYNSQGFQPQVFRPQQNIFMIQNPTNSLKPGQLIQTNEINFEQIQNQSRPYSSYQNQMPQQQLQLPQQPQQQQNIDVIGYNSMNGFAGFTNQYQTYQNASNMQLQQNPLISHHQRTVSGNVGPNFDQFGQSYIFKQKISFKQAIFFIHHCRLVFKFLFLYKDTSSFDENLYLKIFKYLMSVLTELNKFTDNSGIVADGQKAGLKIKKFKQVNLQYLAKYKKQLQEGNYNINPEPINQGTLNQTNLAIRQVFNRLNEEIALNMRRTYLNSSEQNIIILGHLCIVIIASLKQIQQGIQNKNFKKLLQFKQIQTVLNTPKEEFTMSSYKTYKDKFIL